MKQFRFSTLLWVIALFTGAASVWFSYAPPTLDPTTGVSEQRRVNQVCYEATGEFVKPEFQAQSTMIRVHWITGTVNVDGTEAVGYSKYLYDPELNASVCEIFVPMPKRVVGDDRMDTLGHELLHCLAGQFHAE